MIEPYLIRSRLFLALGVPASLCAILHAWAIVANRKFCHALMGALLCLDGTEKAVRIAVGRKLDALALFLKSSGYLFGTIKRGAETDEGITLYGSFIPNLAVSWIQEQLANDPDISNPIVAIDRYVLEAIARFIPVSQESEKEKKKKKERKRREGAYDSNTLGLTSEALVSQPVCNFVDALRLARMGFFVFPVHSIVAGICSCRWGRHCRKPGKHPCIASWRQVATRYEPSIVRLWGQFPYANVGVACGTRLLTGGFLIVIDCDLRHFGHGSISHLERNELCPLPPTFEQSAGGGPHRFYYYPRAFHSSPGALGLGIDIQGLGKYVVGAGINARGTRYAVTVDLPIARLPDEWANRIDAVRNKTLPMITEGGRTTALMSWAGGIIGSGTSRDLAVITLRDCRDKRIENGACDFPDERLDEMIDYCVKQEQSKARRVAAA